MVNIAFTQGNVDAFNAYIAMRLAQDGATLTNDAALAEMIAICSKIKNHGGVFDQ